MKKYIYSLFVVLAMALPALATNDDFLISIQGRIYRDEKIMSVSRWSTQHGNLICIYSRPGTYIWGSDVEEQNLQHFVVYMQSNGRTSVVYKEDVYDIILGVVQYNDNLLHVTVPGGSTYHKKIYSFDGRKVSVRFN